MGADRLSNIVVEPVLRPNLGAEGVGLGGGEYAIGPGHVEKRENDADLGIGGVERHGGAWNCEERV